MTLTTSLSNLLQWAAQFIAILLEVLFSPSVFEEGQTQKALTFGTAKASTLNPTTMKTSDQCAETSDANHLPTKACRTIAWAIAADISRLLWQQVLPRELAWWSSPEWVRRQQKERTSWLRHQQEIIAAGKLPNGTRKFPEVL